MDTSRPSFASRKPCPARPPGAPNGIGFNLPEMYYENTGTVGMSEISKF